ncbi:hypothetical protein B1C78_00155 [Thioalkalivibrio denitrificans]|uniref:HNH endonuclease 5 domain-containing protein n=1 Tax=Thioalkalivibrio denitrificans TaxID=108003 RepID=A0A1V3NUZ6_9GAMM|nr:hypothetical protein [Thioalkalivibrio denitrificans]OOG28794.1 hypothetical protein B1C78_00155 [Thioalkalivibrio denitrificans]
MKQCAYCSEDRKLTKEHIWPSSIIKKYESKLASYNKKLDSFVYSDPVIKDVCEECNNVLLSPLDAYLSSLYDEHLHQSLNPGDSTELSFDREMLLRALLKISFNSARASAAEDIMAAHRRFAPYILRGGYSFGVQLRLLVVTSSKIIADGELQEKHFPVSQLRCADIPYDGPLSHRFIVRLIAINSFWFYLLISKKREPEDKWRKFLTGFKTWKIQPGIPLGPGVNKVEIPVNQTTYMTPQLMETMWEAIRRAQQVAQADGPASGGTAA